MAHQEGRHCDICLMEADTVQYMNVLGQEHKIKQQLQVKPRNWIPKSANVALIEVNESFSHIDDTVMGEDSFLTLIGLHTTRRNKSKTS